MLPTQSQSDYVIENLDKEKDNARKFLEVLIKDKENVLDNLMSLEEAIDMDNFIEVVREISSDLINNLVENDETKAYLYYLKLKIEIMKHDKDVSIQSIISKSFDFSIDRIVSEFNHNLLYLKKIYKFILFENRQDKSLHNLIFNRIILFQNLSIKLFKLLLFFTCHVDILQDNDLLIRFSKKIKEYYDINERYLISLYSFKMEDDNWDLLRVCIENYTKDLLVYLKMLAYNREKKDEGEEVKTLVLIVLVFEKITKTHEVTFFELSNDVKRFINKVNQLKKSFKTPVKKRKSHIRRTKTEDKSHVLSNIMEDSKEDIEFEEEINEIIQKEQLNRLSTIKEMSSHFEKQSNQFETLNDEDFQKLNFRKKFKMRRLSFRKPKKNSLNFI